MASPKLGPRNKLEHVGDVCTGLFDIRERNAELWLQYRRKLTGKSLIEAGQGVPIVSTTSG